MTSGCDYYSLRLLKHIRSHAFPDSRAKTSRNQRKKYTKCVKGKKRRRVENVTAKSLDRFLKKQKESYVDHNKADSQLEATEKKDRIENESSSCLNKINNSV